MSRRPDRNKYKDVQFFDDYDRFHKSKGKVAKKKHIEWEEGADTKFGLSDDGVGDYDPISGSKPSKCCIIM